MFVHELVPEKVPLCVASVHRPSVVLAAAASTSSASERPKDVKSASAAVPDHVKYGNLSAALTSHAIAASSASYACTSVPITSPRFVLAVAASDAPVHPSATGTSVPHHLYIYCPHLVTLSERSKVGVLFAVSVPKVV